jgi:hypothetical protein
MFRRNMLLPSSESTVCRFWLGYIDTLEEGGHVTQGRGTEGPPIGTKIAPLRGTLTSLHTKCRAVPLEGAVFLTVPFPTCDGTPVCPFNPISPSGYYMYHLL